MATYKITSPDGQAFNVTAPDGASESDVMAYAQRNFKMQAKEAPKAKEPGLIESLGAGLGSGVGKVAMGAQHYLGKGLGAVGADAAGDWLVNDAAQGRAKMAGEVAPFKAANPMTTGAGELASEIGLTLPLGGVLAKSAQVVAPALSSIPRVGQLLNSIKSSGMALGTPAATTTAGKVADMATRAAGGAITGGVSAGLINPEDAGTGAMVGAAAPGVLGLAGKAGTGLYNTVKGNSTGKGKLLANAMGASDAELPGIIKALQDAPESIVDGSRLTVSQALQLKGANTPGVKMLERIASGGTGGDPLLKAYANQGAARMGALEGQGAQVYQGAAAQEADMGGNKIASILRTQAGDDKAAARAAWEALHTRANNEGVALQFPLDSMRKAMDPLGRGTVGAGQTAKQVIQEAENIGTDVLPALRLTPQNTAKTQNLEQAVRSLGGIKPGNYLGKEIAELGRKQSKTTGLVTTMGKDVETLADQMHARGFIQDNDPATLLDALRNGAGRKTYASDFVEEAFARRADQAMGEPPGKELINKAVPFSEFQRLRRSAGELAAKVGSRDGGETEAGVLNNLKGLLSGRVDDAAAGNLLPGESMSQGFRDSYEAARDMTRANAERYKGGNNISQILRKPVGQNYTIGGNEVMNKLWHGGAGLADDVGNLRNVLTNDNQRSVMDTLQKYIMTDAASKTTASGDLAAALPRYVETRMPGLLAALEPDQFKALSSVAKDIDNASAAANVNGLLGSDTQAKISRAMDGGLLESPMINALSRVKGLNVLRDKGVEMVKAYKGKTISELMANPKDAAKALQDASFVRSLDAPTVTRLQLAAARSAPALAAN